MKTSILKLVKWFCRQLTFNELASAIIILHEVLNKSRNDIPLKPNDKPPHYRQFRVDTIRPLPALKVQEPPNWQVLKAEKEQQTGKTIQPVRHRQAKQPPKNCHCSHCQAPANYLYLNNGRMNSQVKCKICGKTGPTHMRKRISKAVYRCPHCSYSLFKWKTSKQFTTYKCPNYQCSHYLKNKASLNTLEKTMRSQQKYNPNFKLHYQYREYHISPEDLKTARPALETVVDLQNIHHSYHTLGLVLTLSINLGLSSRLTRNALKDLFDISISHQTVINYINSAASHLSFFIDAHCPVPKSTCAADETYIIVEGQWTYTWFIIDADTRAICGYNLSQTRETQPALALLYDCYGRPDQIEQPPNLITDGNPSYDSAVMAYNDTVLKKENKITKRTVIGLQNLDTESTEYRSFKQLIERLNRTYKYHTRPRAGFKTFDGAISLTTLFVAYYNFLRPHSAIENSAPVSLGCLKKCRLAPEKWTTLIRKAAA